MAFEQTQLDTIQQFARSVETFCALLEDQTLTDTVFVWRCAAALAALYHDVLDLPDLREKGCPEKIHVDRTALTLPASVCEHIKHLNFYSVYFDPYDPDSGVYGDLNDDLSDIYQDVRSGLEVYRLGTRCALVDAVFEWKLSFSAHWGQHSVWALSTLHHIMTENRLANHER